VAVDPDGGSTDGRATGSGVVLRLREAAVAFPPPGFSALPLLLVVGAITGGLASRGAGALGYAAVRMRGSRVAEDGQRATGGLYSIHWAVMFNVGDGTWGLHNASGRALGVVCCRWW
jgi:hypothetical protein